MSKQTLKRQNRRASRKINQKTRELKRAGDRIFWLSQNLEQAFKAMSRMRDRAQTVVAEAT